MVKKRKKRRRVRPSIKIFSILCLLIVILLSVNQLYPLITSKKTSNKTEEIIPTVAPFVEDDLTMDNVSALINEKYVDDKPGRIKELANIHPNPLYKKIWLNIDEYSDFLLKSLVVNPELVTYTGNYLNPQNSSLSLTDEEKSADYPLFMQWDERWGYRLYGTDNFALTACGPTTLSMTLYTILRDDTINPYSVAQFAVENGYWVKNGGSMWSLISAGAKHYGVNVSEVGLDENLMKRELDQGHLLILILKKGDFTLGGHFVEVYGYDDQGFKINDPNSVRRSSVNWPYDRISSQINNIWTLYK